MSPNWCNLWKQHERLKTKSGQAVTLFEGVQAKKQINKQVTRNTGNQPTLFSDDFLTWDAHSGQGRRASSSIRSSLYYSMHFVQKGREEGNGKCCKSERSLPLLYLPRVGMWCLLYYVVTVANLAIGFCQTYGIMMVLSDCLFDLGLVQDWCVTEWKE